MSDPVLSLIQKQGLAYRSSGRDYLVACINPEHPDSDPSMRIDRITGLFNCFSCGFKGNLFKYYGVLTSLAPIKLAKLKDRLTELKTAHTGLELPKGATPYTKVFRNISTQTLKRFGAFYTTQVEKLEDRICFPIKDITGKTQVYVARHTLSSGNPRYVNYPQGVTMPLYPAQVPAGYKSVVLVEGIFDMLNLYDKGLENVACCFGTNTLQADTGGKLLAYKAQGVTHVFIAFDGDAAGEKAALLLKPLIEAEGFVVEIINLPDGTDPGELDSENVHIMSEYVNK